MNFQNKNLLMWLRSQFLSSSDILQGLQIDAFFHPQNCFGHFKIIFAKSGKRPHPTRKFPNIDDDEFLF